MRYGILLAVLGVACGEDRPLDQPNPPPEWPGVVRPAAKTNLAPTQAAPHRVGATPAAAGAPGDAEPEVEEPSPPPSDGGAD